METALMLFILVVVSLLVVLVVWFLAEMAMLPGKIARSIARIARGWHA